MKTWPCTSQFLKLGPAILTRDLDQAHQNGTVIVRVIAHAGVIEPLWGNFSSLESFNSFSAHGSES